MGTRESHNPADPKDSKEGGIRGAPYLETESPAAHMKDHGEAAVLLQPLEVRGGADPTPEQVDAWKVL